MGHPIIGWLVIAWGLLSWHSLTKDDTKTNEDTYILVKAYGDSLVKILFWIQLVAVGIEAFIAFFLPIELLIPNIGFILSDVLWAFKYHKHIEDEDITKAINLAGSTGTKSGKAIGSLSVASVLLAGFILI